jgi:predicted DCC family thiol-disulfide oxidoreductase YuxK
MEQKNIKLDFETIIFYSRGKISQESEAIVSILYVMGGFYRILSRLIKPIPINIRNLIYKLISKNRYQIFGKREHCMIPDDKIKQRFL